MPRSIFEMRRTEMQALLDALEEKESTASAAPKLQAMKDALNGLRQHYGLPADENEWWAEGEAEVFSTDHYTAVWNSYMAGVGSGQE